ncbi:MAG: exodeoxyribonuclease VII large subunit [Parcubacteria group bacterium RIFCSPLOWO2_01_FULL_40_65]|nr:MAG: exodeoxyribonuclease VII large subunit [Parcubacteria group bacterium RIFCSPHIGHO2_01_FULL_40_30]OHB18770.1 MAG: exodeoxyribonuclease VII large subunit [Parcubacteria group bacterium RIFCSPHIGHO2_02_FULL_40_12]OHB20986.1 MAG: exodeoxyribonuclease VII large subunit [Parcubacteria group bacterium RIFCSPLOWO2_01_FULL_40_65]OHB22648.1 MAG: exodeoxyribonuclease VII large subunit [Parcubacteria group bacterium RIFCSPLOWO2_02_FULL_40_12]
MDNILLQKLKSWRKNAANLQGIEPFRVFANKVLENIAEVGPKNKDELMAIKGIRDKKYAKYGKDVLAIINGEEILELPDLPDKQLEKPLSVSKYLGLLNKRLSKYQARIRGEVSSLDIRGNYLFFSLKDKDDGSTLSCFMWKSNYELCGISLEIGMEIIVEGFPEVYAPSGRFNFRTSTVELIGEGELKKAYDRLKKKLEAEDLFLEERKRKIPDLLQRIGLITSETGAVIHDFLNNLNKYGFQTTFMDSRVEGQGAVKDLIFAIDYFRNKDIDVLVIIRGGGSLESLQAFNNETLVRKIAGFNKPVICGIGHEKDVPLASLAADKMVSTATAAAHILNGSWQKAVHGIELNKKRIFVSFNDALSENLDMINNFFQTIKDRFGLIFRSFNRAEESLKRSFVSLRSRISEIKRGLIRYPGLFSSGLFRAINQTKQRVLSLEKLMLTYNPERQLKLGYSIVRSGGKIVKSIGRVKIGRMVDVKLSDGGFESEVKKIHKK